MDTPDYTEVDEEFQKLLMILDTKDTKYRNKSEKENSHMKIVRKSLETLESIRYTPSHMKLYMNEDQLPEINQVLDDTEQQQQQQQPPLSSVDSSPIAHTDSFTDLYPDNSLQFDTDSPLLATEENSHFESSTPPVHRPFISMPGMIDSRATQLDKSQSLSSEANEEVNR